MCKCIWLLKPHIYILFLPKWSSAYWVGSCGKFHRCYFFKDSPHSSCPLCISSGSGSARRSPAGLRPSPIHHRGDTITCWSPSHRDHQSVCFPITTDPNHPGITLARKTQSFYFLVRETNHSVVRILQTELPSFYLSQKVDVHARITTPCRIPRSRGGLQQDQSQPASNASNRWLCHWPPTRFTTSQGENLPAISAWSGVYEIIYWGGTREGIS